MPAYVFHGRLFTGIGEAARFRAAASLLTTLGSAHHDQHELVVSLHLLAEDDEAATELGVRLVHDAVEAQGLDWRSVTWMDRNVRPGT